MRLFIGLDPGAVSGAWGVVNHHGDYVASGEIPNEDGRIKALQLRDQLGHVIGSHDAIFVVEDVHSMPKQGVASTFTFARAVGAIEAVTELFRDPWFIVRPQRWKADMGVTSDKNTSLELARTLWTTAPLTRKKDHGVAEALLLAEWIRRQEL